MKFLTMKVKMSNVTTVLLLLVSLTGSVISMKCWQCAAVDGRKCPEDAKSVTSVAHDACIIWKMGNGTILLQNLVRFDEECVSSKVDFWSRFIDLYYQGVGGSVKCCSGDGCNSGDVTDKEISRQPDAVRSSPIHISPPSSASLPGAPLSPFFAASNVIPDRRLSHPAPKPARNPAPINRPTKIAKAPTQNFYPQYPQQPEATSFNQKRLQLATSPSSDSFSIIGSDVADGIPNGRNGNCQQYFDRIASEEWLPRILVPLTFDRASETKVGVFYTRLKTFSSSNDHVIVRILDKDKKNTTMYSFKLFQVGTVSLHLNTLEPDSRGDLKQVEVREQAINHAINLTDSRYVGFWITVRNEELALGKIGSPLVNPIISWNDTLRKGPKEPFYFGLTTDKAAASFGVNCDVPNLHFSDTCVTDNDCENIPNTVCRHAPGNKGLDPGTRKLPYEEWSPRDSLLKSCFCKAGHVRIPESKGCYDPIRRVVTLRDACFADYHCNDLPNTICAMDREIPKFNMSCQCIRGNRPFDPDPRTGLVEGCAPLTDEDMGTILGCSTRFSISDDKTEWVPKDTMYSMDFDSNMDADIGVFFVNLGTEGAPNDEAIIRLLDENKASAKMLTLKFSRRDGRISISESTRSSSFFFSSGERDYEKANYEDLEIMSRMENGYVGYWVMYQYEKGIGGVLTLGMNGSPVTPDFAVVKWTDTGDSALKGIKYMGFTSSNNAKIGYGVNCALIKTTPEEKFNQVPQQQLTGLTGYGHSYSSDPSYGHTYSSDPSGRYGPIVTNLNQARPIYSNNLHRQFEGTPAPVDPSWDYDTSRVDSYDTADYSTDLEPETIIEPELRNQYLTKLKRLLPTFFEDFDGHEIESLLGNSTIQAIEDWHGLMGMEPVLEDDQKVVEKEKVKEDPTPTIS